MRAAELSLLRVFEKTVDMQTDLRRKLGASVTVFWGLFGTPCPLPRAVTYVRGKPLGLPKVENPSQEQVDEWHKKYVAEVKRIFDTYKHLNPDYASKNLTVAP